jgi:DNA-binding NarL/FixJ family response regulator
LHYLKRLFLQRMDVRPGHTTVGGKLEVDDEHFDIDEYVFEALRVGASRFLVKSTEPAELVHAGRVVAAGDALLSPGGTKRLVAEFAMRAKGGPISMPALELLTDREREVMGAGCCGALQR